MNTALIRDFFLWYTLVGYGIVLLWFLIFVLAHDWVHRLHGRWFHLSTDMFDAIHYAGMALLKIGIMLFGLIPLIVFCVLPA